MLQNLPLGDTLEFCAYKSQYFKQIYSWQEILGEPYSINTAFILHKQSFKIKFNYVQCRVKHFAPKTGRRAQLMLLILNHLGCNVLISVDSVCDYT